MEEVTPKEKKIIEKEVKKRIAEVLYDKTRASAYKFKSEFRSQTVTAMTAAFAFLIALSWREPIQQTVNSIIASLGLSGDTTFLKYLAAIIITIIAVVSLIFLSRWNSKTVK